MAKLITAECVVIPVSNTKKIEVWTQGLTKKLYEFTAGNYPTTNIEYYEPEGLAAFQNASGYLEVWKLENTQATRIHYAQMASIYLMYANPTFDNDGNIYAWGYSSSRFFYKIDFDPANQTYSAPVNLAKNAAGTTVTNYTAANLGWGALDSYTGRSIYVPETNELWLFVGGYNTTTEYNGYWAPKDNILFLIYRIDDDDFTPVSMSDLGFYEVDYICARSTVGNNSSWSITYHGLTYNKARNSVYVALNYSPHWYSMSMDVIVGIDITTHHCSMMANMDTFFQGVSAGSGEGYYRLYSSPLSGRLVMISGRSLMSWNPDNTIHANFDFSPTVDRYDIAFNQMTEDLLLGHSAGFVVFDHQGNQKASVYDASGYHPNACYVNNADSKPPLGMGATSFIYPSVGEATADTTPTVLMKVGRSPAGWTQQFLLCVDSDKDNIALKDHMFEYDGSYASFTSSANYADLTWEYSTDYEEATGTGTWDALGTGDGMQSGGTEGTNGVLCDDTQPHVYVRATLPNTPVGNYYLKVYAVSNE
jgi:FlaG/FlaF family flagellin (archaellin)